MNHMDKSQPTGYGNKVKMAGNPAARDTARLPQADPAVSPVAGLRQRRQAVVAEVPRAHGDGGAVPEHLPGCPVRVPAPQPPCPVRIVPWHVTGIPRALQRQADGWPAGHQAACAVHRRPLCGA